MKVYSLINCNISFCWEKKPVYAFDKNGNSQKFDSVLAAQKGLGISATNISQCINGKIVQIKGMTFDSAQNVEKDGKVNEDRVSEILKRFNFTRKRPVYIVKKEEQKFEIKKFSSEIEAAQSLNINVSTLSSCVNKKTKTAGNYFCIPASEVEEKNEKGELILNERKLRKIIEKTEEEKNNFPIYIIDRNFNWERFENVSSAAERINSSKTNILHCLRDDIYTTNGYAVIAAKNVESEIEDKLIVDEEKIKQIAQRKFNSRYKRN